MKKLYKISIVLLILIITFSITCKVQAADIWSIAKGFLEVGAKDVGTFEESTTFFKKLGQTTGDYFEELIDFLWGLGLLAIFVTTVILGMRYMFVSPNEKSKIKQATTPYIIGVVIIFGALTIWKFIIVILDGSL